MSEKLENLETALFDALRETTPGAWKDVKEAWLAFPALTRQRFGKTPLGAAIKNAVEGALQWEQETSEGGDDGRTG